MQLRLHAMLAVQAKHSSEDGVAPRPGVSVEQLLCARLIVVHGIVKIVPLAVTEMVDRFVGVKLYMQTWTIIHAEWIGLAVGVVGEGIVIVGPMVTPPA